MGQAEILDLIGLLIFYWPRKIDSRTIPMLL